MLKALQAFLNHVPELWGDEIKDGYINLTVAGDTIDLIEEAAHLAEVTMADDRKAENDLIVKTGNLIYAVEQSREPATIWTPDQVDAMIKDAERAMIKLKERINP
jgi:hypothetical protein